MGILYTKMKIFHYKDKIESLNMNTDKIMPPVHIRIKPTNVCPHNCRYCAYRADNLQLGKDMRLADYIPKKRMMEIIDDIVEMRVKAVTFSGGGDPFYYPYLLDTVRKLSKTPVKFASLTNGAGLNGEVAEIFAHKGTWLRISMDGWDNESYSFYRKVPEGEFTKVMNNMEDFKKLGGGCFLGVSLIVDRKNSDHVFDFIRRLKEIGVDSVKVSPCIVSNDGEANNEYHRPVFEKVKEQMKSAMEDMDDKDFEIFDAYHELDNKFIKEYTWCPYLQILPVIGADLNIYPCQDKAYNLEEGLVGSIKDQSFRDFWFNDKNKFYKINPSIVCNHHCVANTKNKIVLEYLDTDKEHMGFV
ncbi:MAG TPA: radical SAM protein [Nitrospirae bacterium]|nr:pyrroloquinoline quinone biosynthesis protein PqqE [bacterium BMS3Abin06]HDH11405.1 radical SAM protein [Nitrospirota bacterium]HDZ01441.1 radical SAM protein [Nitrospirota bacterium]